MSKVLTEEEKRRIAANRAEALRRAEERKKREALAAAAAAGAQKVSSAPQQLSRPVTHHVLSAVQLATNPVKHTPSVPQYTSHPSTSTHAPSTAAPSVTEFKPPTPARLPKSHVHVTFSVSRSDRIKIRFSPYHSAVTEAIKTIRSRTYDANDRTWSISLSDLKACEKTLKNLTEVDVSIESVPDSVIKLLTDDSSLKHPVPSDLSLIMDPALIECLFPFQKRGVTFGIERGGRLLLADEMGLGKSVQALTLARYYKSEWPLLIICPSSVKTAWKTQINKFLPVIQKIFLMEKGSDPLPTARTSNTVAILSYDLMVLKKKELEEMNYCVIIFDESHLLKDTKAKRTQVAHALAKRATRVILLSGTPALSRPAELFSQAKGCTNSEELSAILSKRVMIRRLKKDVLTDLPDKRREVVYLSGDKIDTCMDSLKKAKMAFEAGSGVQRGMGNGKGGDDSLLEYYSLTGIVKASAVCSHILDNYFYPDAPKRKVLIFAHHQIVLDTVQVEVQKRNLKSIRIDGQTSSKDRGALCHDFQEDPDVQVAILSMTAAGVGITLTAASVVIFAELHWNPTTLQQAEDRAHRVGQKDSVFVQYLVARNTADDVIWPLIQHKLDDLGKVNLSGETFNSAKRTHMKYETNVPQPKEITDFFATEDEAQNSSKKAKWDE
nr:SNF2-related and DNA RNA helicase domain containing protein [Haemonchus contortus]